MLFLVYFDLSSQIDEDFPTAYQASYSVQKDTEVCVACAMLVWHVGHAHLSAWEVPLRGTVNVLIMCHPSQDVHFHYASKYHWLSPPTILLLCPTYGKKKEASRDKCKTLKGRNGSVEAKVWLKMLVGSL